MDGDMVIAGLSERTREAYSRAVRQLVRHYGGDDPFVITEDQVKDDLRWMRV